jgi:hypothetical protein
MVQVRFCLLLAGLALFMGCGDRTAEIGTAQAPNRPAESPKVGMDKNENPVPLNTVDLRGKRKTCTIHGVELLEDKQEAKAGLSVSRDPEYRRACSALFPNLGLAPFGIQDPQVKWVLVRYCPKCREARLKWLEERRGEKQDP